MSLLSILINLMHACLKKVFIYLNKNGLTPNIWKEVHIKFKMYRTFQTVYIDLAPNSPKPNPILNALRPK